MGWGARSRESPDGFGFVNPGGIGAQQRCRAVRVMAADGAGNYVTIWRRQGDGSWKVAVDIGNADPPRSRAGP